MSKRPCIKILIFLCVFFLVGSLMVSASPADLDSEVGPAATYATTYTVDSGLDLSTAGTGIVDGEPVTLRRAINSALNAPKPVLIEFDIPTTCDSYDSDLEIWKIELLGVGTGAPSNTTFRALNVDITIDGTTQNGRENGPTIILYGEGATGARNCMVLGGTAQEGGNVIKGLGFQNFRDSITISSDGNTVENCWFGYNDEGTAPLFREENPQRGSGNNGVVIATDNQKNNTVRNNKFVGFFGVAAAIRGHDSVFSNNLVGTAANGTVPNPGCGDGSWLGGGGVSVQGRRHLIEDNTIAGLRWVQFDESQPPDAFDVTVQDVLGAGHTIRNNTIGLDINGNIVGSCGRGIYLQRDMHGTLIEGNTIARTSLPGIYIIGEFYNDCELRANIIKETYIDFGETVPEEFTEYPRPVVTSIDGVNVSGTGGSGGGWVELFMDETAVPMEAREFLARVQANEDGTWSTTIPYELTGNQGIRTTLTTTKPNIIPGMRAGTTTNLSEVLYRPDEDEDADISFTDVPGNHPFFDEIVALAASGISTGYDDGTFRPAANVTRQAMAAFLARGLELDQSYNVPSQPSFSDVPLAHPFYEEIELLAASGISTGYDDGTFRPAANVTRQAMAAFLARGLELDQSYNVPSQPTFSDVPLPHPFYEEIELLAASAISTGYDDGTFRPAAIVTRQAMAAFLVRGLDLD